MFGWTRAEALGRELAELIIPERLRDDHRRGMQRYIETGVARVLNKRIELSALHRADREFPVELAITPIGFGDELVFSAFIRDITGRKRAEAALRESEQRFRTTANAAPVLIWMSGRDKRSTWFNQRWLDFVGRDMEQEIGDGWCDNLHPADFDRTLDTYHAAFDARRPYEMEFRLQRDDGAWRWLLERGTPNLGPDGEFEGYIGTCIDITEHRETVEQLRENRARFKTLAESLPQMIWTCLRDGYCDYLSPAVARLHRSQRGAAARHGLARAGASRRSREGADGMGARHRQRRHLRHELPHPPLRRRVSLVQDPRRAAARSRPGASSSGSARTPTSRIS